MVNKKFPKKADKVYCPSYECLNVAKRGPNTGQRIRITHTEPHQSSSFSSESSDTTSDSSDHDNDINMGNNQCSPGDMMIDCNKCQLKSKGVSYACDSVNQKNKTTDRTSLWTLILLLLLITLCALWFKWYWTRPPPAECDDMPFEFPHADPPVIVRVTNREFCSTLSKDLYSLEQMGYVDAVRRVSKLMAMDIGPGGVHYVFTNSTHVPWLYTCSLESTLIAVGNCSRVYVFVIDGIIFERPLYDRQHPVLLTESLDRLTAKYGDDRLKVEHINLEECLENTPFQETDLTRRPALVTFVVQLTLLWQFGGTTLDANLVVVRGEMYPASRTAVEFGTGTISSPVACNAFVYDAMLYTKSCPAYRNRPFHANSGRKLLRRAAVFTGRADNGTEVTCVPENVVCRGGVIDGDCYYVEMDGATFDRKSYVHSFCPVVSDKSFQMRTR